MTEDFCNLYLKLQVAGRENNELQKSTAVQNKMHKDTLLQRHLSTLKRTAGFANAPYEIICFPTTIISLDWCKLFFRIAILQCLPSELAQLIQKGQYPCLNISRGWWSFVSYGFVSYCSHCLGCVSLPSSSSLEWSTLNIFPPQTPWCLRSLSLCHSTSRISPLPNQHYLQHFYSLPVQKSFEKTKAKGNPTST